MSTGRRVIAWMGTAVVSGVVAWLAAWGLVLVWWETFQPEGPRDEAFMGSFGVVIAAFVLGAAVGWVAGTILLWVAGRSVSDVERLRPAIWWGAPLGSGLLMFMFFGSVV